MLTEKLLIMMELNKILIIDIKNRSKYDLYNTILKLIDEISHHTRNPFIEAKIKNVCHLCINTRIISR